MPPEVCAEGAGQCFLTKPDDCRKSGLACADCVRHTAESVVRLCAHLSSDQQRSAFVRLYPDPACERNLAQFQQSYDDAAGRL